MLKLNQRRSFLKLWIGFWCGKVLIIRVLFCIESKVIVEMLITITITMLKVNNYLCNNNRNSKNVNKWMNKLRGWGQKPNKIENSCKMIKNRSKI